MTDTTDIKMLREQAETAKVCGGMFAISGEQALSLLDQLEAERQRADELKINWDAAKNSIQFYKAEIAALKGDQVPVAFTAARWLDTRCKVSVWTDRESAVMEIGDNSKVAELYDRPQKPVVLPGISELIDACDSTPAVRDVHVWDLAISEVKRLNPSLFSDKSAAGGIVKDGE